jgi:Uma2 family endonuclease
MSLEDFEFAEVEEGRIYELHQGIVIVSDGPEYFHSMQIVVIRGAILCTCNSYHAVFGAMECKLLIPARESECHPDITVYSTPPPGKKDRALWRTWNPELAIEVVSEGSRDRDYVEKREEYWELGVKEYWIVDAKLAQVLALRRGRSDWIERALGPTDAIESKLLPGFKLPCKDIFDAARDPDETP